MWSFSKNKSAAKELLLYLSQKPAVTKLVEASLGNDLPAFNTMHDLNIWKTVGRRLAPSMVIRRVPMRRPRSLGTEVGAQIYNQAINTVMVARFTQGGEKLDEVIKWTENELEGTLRS